ncbi:MAG: acyltransferase domain-containing protein [bacterium]|nr:acyltransferase domain-containing protein [bacterium]
MINVEKSELAFGAPGQGWQAPGMDEPLRKSEAAKGVFAQAKQIFGFDVQALCANGEVEGKTLKLHSQAAMGTVMIAAIEDLEARDIHEAVDFSISLGMFGALRRAEVLDSHNVLRAIKVREEMTLAQQNGAMGLVIGLDKVRFAQEFAHDTRASIAVQYSASDFAISGSKEEITLILERIAERKKELGRVKTFDLPIPNSFHHKMLHEVAQQFSAFLAAEVEFHQPVRPIVLNTGLTDNQGEYVQVVTPDTIYAIDILRDELVVQLTQPARIDLVRRELERRNIMRVIEPSGGALGKVFRRLGDSFEVIPTWEYGKLVDVG